MFTSKIRSTITLQNCIYKVHDNKYPGCYPGDIKTLGWCPAGPVLPHGEKVPL